MHLLHHINHFLQDNTFHAGNCRYDPLQMAVVINIDGYFSQIMGKP